MEEGNGERGGGGGVRHANANIVQHDIHVNCTSSFHSSQPIIPIPLIALLISLYLPLSPSRSPNHVQAVLGDEEGNQGRGQRQRTERLAKPIQAQEPPERG